MPHNIMGEVVLHIQDERFLKNLARKAVGRKVPLSFFERQQVRDLGLDKAMDIHGNLDLNEASNIMTQAPSRRISPNVKAAESTREGWTATKSESADVSKAMGEEREGDKARCKRYCKSQGNTSCRYCHGASYEQEVTRRVNKSMGISPNQARDLVDQTLYQGE